MDIERLKEHDLYVLRDVVGGLEEEQSIDPVIARQFEQVIDEAIARQSATSEEVAEAISWAQGMEVLYTEKEMPECVNCAKLAITALKAYQPKGE